MRASNPKKTGIKAKRGRGNPYGREIGFDLPKALKHLEKHGGLTAAATHVGVKRQILWYHVAKSKALRKLVKPKR